ncbi:MAG: Hsp20/alpha crystallin family protein [Haliscomenobacter sp.]|nr:Hsp20/alpha crystallin family protein [Haliscomenobacter sp.]MBK9489303.1 Hsp20/alpha crystallin family protein [Haliscomenobacter sp.]
MILQHFKEEKLYFDDELVKNAWELGKKLNPLPLSPMPALNITEHTKAFVIELVVPGLSHEDLNIHLIDNMLVLRYEGNSNAFESVLDQRQWRQEFRMRPFIRQIPVHPEMVQVDQINISSENGIIVIRLPKMPALSGKVAPIMPFSMN